MQAYATRVQVPLGDQLRALDQSSAVSDRDAVMGCDSIPTLIDQVLSRLADLVVDRLMQHGGASANDEVGDWLDARGAAAYLGILATRCASSPPSRRSLRTRMDLAASSTSAATSSMNGVARLGRPPLLRRG
jgi:hypothetical protein